MQSFFLVGATTILLALSITTAFVITNHHPQPPPNVATYTRYHTRDAAAAGAWKASTLETVEVDEDVTEEDLLTTTFTDTNSSRRRSSNSNSEKKEGGTSFGERLTNSGVASAAAMATAAVNAAVSMKSLEAPAVDKTYIALDKTQQELDEAGLPLVYDKEAIEAYWSQEKGALNQRWAYFVGKAVPFLTKLTALFIKDGKIVDEEIPGLSKQARMDLQDLGPTFIKAVRRSILLLLLTNSYCLFPSGVILIDFISFHSVSPLSFLKIHTSL